MNEKRKNVWIDSFQTKLSVWIAVYFLLYQVICWLLFGIGRLVALHYYDVLPNAFAHFFIVALATLALVAFFFIRDAIHYMHRIVGPIVRFRKAIQAIKDGQDVELMRLREGDYLQELKDEFNEMLAVLEQRGAVRIQTAEEAAKAASEHAAPVASAQAELQR